MAQAIKQLHTGPRFLTDFNMFRLSEFISRFALNVDPVPDGYLERMFTVEQIEKAMSPIRCRQFPVTTTCWRELHRRWRLPAADRL